ncbi:MAG: YbjQ family protein [Desulfocapsaceae bacterium]
MKTLRQIGSVFFVLGLFIVIFLGLPWYVIVADNPAAPWWLRLAVFSLLGGILLVLLTLALEQSKKKSSNESAIHKESDDRILLLNSDVLPENEIAEILGLVQGHTVYAIWLGKDLSAVIRLILGGELTEYTEMMGSARTTALQRMTSSAEKMGADAVINVRYMTTSVIGSAAELLVYGTAVKLKSV